MPSPRMAALAAKLRPWLADRRVIRRAVALAAILSAPVLFQGLQGDDHWMRLLLDPASWLARWAKPPLALFTFWDGDPARTLALADRGFGPWWVDPSARASFLRPLTAATHWLDHRIWPWPWVMHAQSLAWYLALVAAAGVLYRRVLGATAVAGLAAVLFAIDFNHGLVIGWISNRNALTAGLFGVLALVLHDRARRDASARPSVLSAASLGVGLLAGEQALGAVAYLAAYALALDESRWPKRARSLAPHGLVLCAWLVAYRLGHHGAVASGVYIDPVRTPLRFAREVLTNVPLLLQTELGGLPPDLHFTLPPPARWAFWAFAVALVAFAAVAFAPLARDRRARFFAIGALLATVPSAATFPSSRLMLLPGLGILGLVAMVVELRLARPSAWVGRLSRAAAAFCAVWVGGGHLLLSPLLLQLGTHQMQLFDLVIRRLGDGLPDSPELARQRVVVVNAPDAFFTGYIAAQRATDGRPVPRAMTWLAPGTRGMELERTDARSLVVRPDDCLYREGMELLMRAPDSPMPVGSVVAFSDVRIEVTRANAGGVPTEVVFRFASALEDGGLRWVEWKGNDLVPFALPVIGERRRIEGHRATL